MKNIIICAFCATALFFTACKDKKELASDAGIEIFEGVKTGSFTVDGKTYAGNVSTQYFGSNKETDNFSILCQQDDPYTLLQCTFANRKDAESENLKPRGQSYKVDPGLFALSLKVTGSDMEFVADDEKSGGTVKVEGNTLKIVDVKLFDREGNSKTVSETINF